MVSESYLTWVEFYGVGAVTPPLYYKINLVGIFPKDYRYDFFYNDRFFLDPDVLTILPPLDLAYTGAVMVTGWVSILYALTGPSW